MTLVLVGGAVTAAGLQFFLLPNHLIDGGVTGVSIVVAYLTGLPMAVFLVLLNIPFIMLGYKKFGKEFALLSIAGTATLALLTLVHVPNGLTDEPMLAAVFGGVFVGIGVGLVVRYGGIIDGSDTIAVLIDRNTVFSVGEAIMGINTVIILLAGFVFGWEQALYSLVAYFVAHKAIDVTVQGLDESRTLWIVSDHTRAIAGVVEQLVDEPVTHVREPNAERSESQGIILVVITRLQEQQIKAAARAVDPSAFIVMINAHEVMGRVAGDTPALAH